MKILLISDYYEGNAATYLNSKLKKSYNRSGLLYEENLFWGFVDKYGEKNVKMLSVPTSGTYPTVTKALFIPKFKSSVEGLNYIPFINLLYYRNISRTIHLKKELRVLLKDISPDENIYITAIQLHAPFMEAVKFIKKHHKKTYACINVWDFPDMMNNRNMGLIKSFLKRKNSHSIKGLLSNFDLMFYLCKQMSDKGGEIPFIVHEGIISKEQIDLVNIEKNNCKKDGLFHVVYTGKFTIEDGVMDLVHSIVSINNEQIVLDIAGGGEIADLIIKVSEKCPRIRYHGVLCKSDVLKLQSKADLFVFPRLPEDYTSYSFPSKIIEYALAGAPILCHSLKCFPSDLKDSLIIMERNDNMNLRVEIEKAYKEINDGKYKVNYDEFIMRNMNSYVVADIIESLDAIRRRYD